jgi:hypothetical protein
MLCTVAIAVLSSPLTTAAATLRVGPAVEVVLPDYLAEVRSFQAEPPAWNEGIVNAGWGGGRGAPDRREGWMREHWLLLDYLDRSGDFSSNDYLEHRGIFHDYGESNEYQESIHFHEEGALALFGENGIARDLDGELVRSQHFDAYIMNAGAPRWWSVLNYDWIANSLFGDAISQDNIGAPIHRSGLGESGRFDDHDNRHFMHHLEASGRLPEFRRSYRQVREYANQHLRTPFEKLPPYAKGPADRNAVRRISGDPVMAEYRRFRHLSHLHAFMRLYRDVKVLAERADRTYDVHGNQGGGFTGLPPYAVLLANFVDSIWFESSGWSEYDVFKNGWSNAWGPFRFELGEAMSGGRKPVLFMSELGKPSADLAAHAWAETSAGGGVLFVDQLKLAAHPKLLELLEVHYRFRDEHRAIFERRGRRRHAQVGLLYSIPTLLYDQYLTAVNTPPVNALAGAARALEEGHVPYDVVILAHPDLGFDHLEPEDLRRYAVLVAPSLEALSERHAALLRDYLHSGGTLAVLGRLGVVDEQNRRRPRDLMPELERAGRVITLLDGDAFPSSRSRESEATRARSRAVYEAIRRSVGAPLIRGDLPRMLWVKAWQHEDGFVSTHWVNYDVDYGSGKARPTAPVTLRLRLPSSVPAEEAAWLVPGRPAQTLSLRAEEGGCAVTLPSVRVYGVLVVGRRGLDRAPSLLRRGDRHLLRASYAGRVLANAEERIAAVRTLRGPRNAADFAAAAERLLRSIADERERAHIVRVHELADPNGALRSFDFGGAARKAPWIPVEPDTLYQASRGYGWLPSRSPPQGMPEERYYVHARRHGGDPDAIRTSGVPSWPHPQPLPLPLRKALSSGREQRFRVDLPDDLYRVDVVQANSSWSNWNYLVSGLTRVGDRVVLLDTPIDEGSLLGRSFTVQSEGGFLELRFGGPTGWSIAALLIRPAYADHLDPLEVGGLRTWWVSPRHPNPDWYPIDQVRAPPELDPAAAMGEREGWVEFRTPEAGLPLVDLGSPGDAEIGDVVYAAAIVERRAAGVERLHLGASSAAVAWLNGERVAYLPNLKGVSRDEALVDVPLRAGRNLLLLKLQRFWERRWLFYASLTSSGARQDGAQVPHAAAAP